jgi:hypothetical protein
LTSRESQRRKEVILGLIVNFLSRRWNTQRHGGMKSEEHGKNVTDSVMDFPLFDERGKEG